MITMAVCMLRKRSSGRTYETKMYDSGGLAVGNEYNLNLDGEVAEWVIIKIKDKEEA